MGKTFGSLAPCSLACVERSLLIYCNQSYYKAGSVCGYAVLIDKIGFLQTAVLAAYINYLL
jgi:hypothetical protein